MFVIVKQDSFATVSVGILKLLLPVSLLAFKVRGYEISNVYLYEGKMFCIYFFYYYYCCECSVFESRDFMVTLCCLCCPAKAC